MRGGEEDRGVQFSFYIIDLGKRKELGPSTACVAFLLTLYSRLRSIRRSHAVPSGEDSFEGGITAEFYSVQGTDPYVNPEEEGVSLLTDRLKNRPLTLISSKEALGRFTGLLFLLKSARRFYIQNDVFIFLLFRRGRLLVFAF